MTCTVDREELIPRSFARLAKCHAASLKPAVRPLLWRSARSRSPAQTPPLRPHPAPGPTCGHVQGMPTAPRSHYLMLRLPFLVYKEAVADRTDIAEGLLQVRFSPGIAQPLHKDRLAGLALLRLHACRDAQARPLPSAPGLPSTGPPAVQEGAPFAPQPSPYAASSASRQQLPAASQDMEDQGGGSSGTRSYAGSTRAAGCPGLCWSSDPGGGGRHGQRALPERGRGRGRVWCGGGPGLGGHRWGLGRRWPGL